MNPVENLRARRAREKRTAAGAQRPRRAGKLLRAAVCVLILLLLCVPPVFVSSALGYLPVLFYLLLLLMSFVYLQVLARGVSFGGIASAHSVPRDTDVKLLLRFRSKVPLPCPRLDAVFCVTDIFGEDDVVESFSVSLGPKQTRTFAFGVRFAHIGTCRAGIQRVTLRDPLGIFSKELPASAPVSIEVTPRIFEIDESVARSLTLNESKESMTPFQRDGMDFTAVREYRPGDPMKTVHWKLSARLENGELYTRLYETSGSPGIDVVLDTFSPEYANQDLMSLYDTLVESSLSMRSFGRKHRLNANLLFFDRGGKTACIPEDRELDYRELMADLPLPSCARGEGLAAEIIRERAGDQNTPGNIVVVASRLEDDLVVSMLAAQGRGKKLALFLVMPPGLDSAQMREVMAPARRLDEAGISTTPLVTSEQVQEVRHV